MAPETWIAPILIALAAAFNLFVSLPKRFGQKAS